MKCLNVEHFSHFSSSRILHSSGEVLLLSDRLNRWALWCQWSSTVSSSFSASYVNIKTLVILSFSNSRDFFSQETRSRSLLRKQEQQRFLEHQPVVQVTGWMQSGVIVLLVQGRLPDRWEWAKPESDLHQQVILFGWNHCYYFLKLYIIKTVIGDHR